MAPELTKAINELAITLLGGVTTIFIPWAFSLVRAYAKAKVEAIKNAEMRKALEFGLQRLDATAETVVTEINQTIRDNMADGKIDRTEAKQLLTKAYNRTLSRLPEDAKATLESAFKDRLQAVIVGKIEAKVAAFKV